MTENRWQLQEARSHFSELVNRALSEGPQVITRRGETVVVVVSKREYDRITHPQASLVEFFRQSPLVGIELDLERDRS